MKSAVALNNLRDTKIYLTINLQSFYMTSMIHNFQLLMLRYITSFLVNRYITLRNNKWMVYLCPVIGWVKLLVLREIRSIIHSKLFFNAEENSKTTLILCIETFFPFNEISIPYFHSIFPFHIPSIIYLTIYLHCGSKHCQFVFFHDVYKYSAIIVNLPLIDDISIDYDWSMRRVWR